MDLVAMEYLVTGRRVAGRISCLPRPDVIDKDRAGVISPPDTD